MSGLTVIILTNKKKGVKTEEFLDFKFVIFSPHSDFLDHYGLQKFHLQVCWGTFPGFLGITLFFKHWFRPKQWFHLWQI